MVVWTFGDPHVIPPQFRTIAADAAVQPPFPLNDLRGGNKTNVGWAILLPRPSYALHAGRGAAEALRVMRAEAVPNSDA